MQGWRMSVYSRLQLETLYVERPVGDHNAAVSVTQAVTAYTLLIIYM